MTEEEFKIVGDLKTSRRMSTQEAQYMIQELQSFMNDAGITKIDVCLDPFNKGPVRITPSINIVSTQN